MHYFAVKSAASGARMTSSPLRFAMFHSTPALDRKRRSYWASGAATGSSSKKRFNYHSKRMRKIEEKQVLLRNVSAYAERLFQSWKIGSNKADPSSKGKSWSRDSSYYSGSKKHSYHPQESEWQSYRSKGQGTVNFVFADESDDEEVETIFRSAFHRAQFSFWSSTEEAHFSWRNSFADFSDEETSTFEYDYDCSSHDKKSRLHSKDLASDLQALGLSTTSLELGKVKKAYRACALKWHPDRHQGSAKAAAEEKFKRCSAAYQSLCDRLEAA